MTQLKKRNKKLHRKELIKKLENKVLDMKSEEGKQLNKIQKACRYAIWTGVATSKLVVMTIGVYAVQLFANTQFNGQIPPAVEFFQNLGW